MPPSFDLPLMAFASSARNVKIEGAGVDQYTVDLLMAFAFSMRNVKEKACRRIGHCVYTHLFQCLVRLTFP